MSRSANGTTGEAAKIALPCCHFGPQFRLYLNEFPMTHLQPKEIRIMITKLFHARRAAAGFWLLAALLFFLDARAGNLLLNGSFESPPITANSLAVMNPDSWQATIGRMINGTYSSPGYPGPQDGQQYVSLGNDGTGGATLSQPFTIDTADTYTLSWFDGAEQNPPPTTAPYSVTILNAGAMVVSTNLSSWHATGGWVSHSMPLGLSPGRYTLTFVSLQVPDGTASLIDNVSLVSSQSSLDFAVTIPDAVVSSGGDLHFCSGDVIHCEPTIPLPAGSVVQWQIDASGNGEETALDPSPASGAGPSVDFSLKPLEHWPNYTPSWPNNLYRARSLLSFTVTAQLVDASGSTLATKAHTITQSDLGQLRQEYVDLPVHNQHFPVGAIPPEVARFSQGGGMLNSGMYRWAIVPQWAVQTAVGVLAQAPATIDSCFRNPVYNANVDLRNLALRLSTRDVNFQSLHQWGAAIDFLSDASSYCQMARLCMNYGDVVWEGTTSHVHVQQYGAQQNLLHCRP